MDSGLRRSDGGGVDSGPRQRDGRGWITPAPGGLGHVFQAPLGGQTPNQSRPSLPGLRRDKRDARR